MHDFLQSPSFHPVAGAVAPGAGKFRGNCRWAIMSSFDDDAVPFSAYRPSPAKRNHRRKPRSQSGQKS